MVESVVLYVISSWRPQNKFMNIVVISQNAKKERKKERKKEECCSIEKAISEKGVF